jgi:type IV pilus assembly protein PilZ
MKNKPVGKDKRKYHRVEAKIKVVFPTLQDLKMEYTRNISAGGIFLKTNRQLDSNAEIDLVLFLPNSSEELHLKGRVVRVMSMSNPADSTSQLYGVGIRFLRLDPDVQAIIEKELEKLSNP